MQKCDERTDGWTHAHTHAHMHIRKAFYNLLTTAFGRRRVIKTLQVNGFSESHLHCVMPYCFSGFHISVGGHGGRVVTLSPPTSEVAGPIPFMALSGKAGSCLPLVGSLQYTTLANSMYWFTTTRRDMTCTVLKAT